MAGKSITMPRGKCAVDIRNFFSQNIRLAKQVIFPVNSLPVSFAAKSIPFPWYFLQFPSTVHFLSFFLLTTRRTKVAITIPLQRCRHRQLQSQHHIVCRRHPRHPHVDGIPQLGQIVVAYARQLYVCLACPHACMHAQSIRQLNRYSTKLLVRIVQ